LGRGFFFWLLAFELPAWRRAAAVCSRSHDLIRAASAPALGLRARLRCRTEGHQAIRAGAGEVLQGTL